MNKILKSEIVRRFGNQYQFSRRICWHESEVSRVIRGRRQLKREERSLWAETLNVDLNKFKKILSEKSGSAYENKTHGG
jgi:hypothetical protein